MKNGIVWIQILKIQKKVRNMAFSEPLVLGIKLEDPEMADECLIILFTGWLLIQYWKTG